MTRLCCSIALVSIAGLGAVVLWPLEIGKPAMLTPTMVAVQATASTRGTWQWVPPQRLENGNIATDLDHFVMYRRAPGEMPAVFAKIHDVQKPQQWTMGIDQAGACFWFVAVRKPGSSAPMPSDKSNVICLDDQGQPLPQT